VRDGGDAWPVPSDGASVPLMDTSARIPARRERRRLVEEAWVRYVRDGVGPAGVRDEIADSWRRCQETYKVDPGIHEPARALTAEELATALDRDEVLALAAPVLADFVRRMDLNNQVLAYFDGQGWMLSLEGDRRIMDRLTGIGFEPGTSWAEASAGTNGPGTALARSAPTSVFASEHFVEAWHPWSCAAAPVRAPGGAAPVGLVDITGPWELQRRQALVAARAIARAIEERLRAVVGVRQEVVRHAFRDAHEKGEALVAVDGRGRVIAANDAASRTRLVSGALLRAGLGEALGDGFRSQPGSDFRIELPDGRPLVVLPVRYEGATVGAILRAAPAPATGRRRVPSRSCAHYDFETILGDSPPLRRAVELARTAAGNDLPVVLSGESGTGKELFAHAIHAGSKRREGPFVAVNCGSIPAQLVEAELFGYEDGTFTGARQGGRPGRFEEASAGTLLLDEVSELPLLAQIALLRVLQEKEVVRLGSSAPRPIDVRVLAATNRPLEDEVRAGRFRRDLYYRLNVLPIPLPPLSARGDDVGLLARVILGRAEEEVGRSGLSLTDDALAALSAHPWPGNVRELKNVLLRAAATAPSTEIRAADLVLERVSAAGEAPRSARVEAGARTLEAATTSAEREVLLARLEECGWNFAAAAHKLGVSRMTLYRRVHKCGISRIGRRR